MGFFNSGGLITRGYGEDHRIITRGMSVRFDFGGIRKVIKRYKEYVLNLLAPVSKGGLEEVGIYSPLEVRKREKRSLFSRVYKKVEERINLVAGIDHSKLSEILDAI